MPTNSAWIHLGWVDVAMAAVLAISVATGLMRGVVFELMSLAGWFVAYFAAVGLAPMLASQISVGPPGSALNHLIAVAAVFIVALVVWGLLARLVRLLVRRTPLSGFDRLLGSAFGSLRALLVLLIVAGVVGATPWSRSPAWQRSRAVPWLEAALRQVKPFLPFEVHQTPRGGSYVRHRWRDLQEPGQPVDL